MNKTKVKSGKELPCQECGKMVFIRPYRFDSFKYCSQQCAGKNRMRTFDQSKIKRNYGVNHPRYKGGSKSQHGYWKVCIDGKQVYQHRYVMEQHIGRKLERSEQVHHLDGDKLNNDINNLLLLPSAQAHREYHRDNDIGFKRACRVCKNDFIAAMQMEHVCIPCKTYTCEACGVTKVQEKYLRARRFCSTYCNYNRH